MTFFAGYLRLVMGNVMESEAFSKISPTAGPQPWLPLLRCSNGCQYDGDVTRLQRGFIRRGYLHSMHRHGGFARHGGTPTHHTCIYIYICYIYTFILYIYLYNIYIYIHTHTLYIYMWYTYTHILCIYICKYTLYIHVIYIYIYIYIHILCIYMWYIYFIYIYIFIYLCLYTYTCNVYIHALDFTNWHWPSRDGCLYGKSTFCFSRWFSHDEPCISTISLYIYM